MTPINAATKRNNQESGLAGKRDPKKEQTPALVELKQKMRKRQLLAETKDERRRQKQLQQSKKNRERQYEERTNEEPIHKQKEIAEKEKAEEPPPARRYQRSWAKPNYSRLNFMMA